MPTFLRKLFEQYAKRLLTNKVRPSILEEGIMTIPNNKRVTLMAENLYKDFKKAGVPDNILKTENDIKVFHHKIAEMNNENVANRLGTFEDIFAPKKPAEVFDLKGNKIKNPNNIMGGEEMIDPNSELAKSIRMEAEAEKKLKKLNMSDKEIDLRGDRPYDTDEQIKKRLMDQNKKSSTNIKNNRQLTDEEIRDYELELGDSETWLNKGTFGEAEQALKNQKAYEAKMFKEYKSIGGSKRPGGPKASERDSMPIRLMKNFEKELNEADLMAEGYSKDQANVLIKARKKMTSGDEMNPNESLLRVKEEFADNAGVDVEDFTDIDFEIDIPDYAKGGRAGLYQGGQAMVGEDLSQIGHGSDSLMARNMQLAPNSMATTSTGLNYLLGEDNDTVRVPYNEGNMVLPKPKPAQSPLVELSRIYKTYEEAMPGVSKDTQKYLQQDFIQKLNDAGISQEAFMTYKMQNNFADGGPARQNFAMGKRAFLKWMASGAAGIAGLKTGLLGFGKKSAVKSVIAPATQAANEAAVPPYFLNLVKKIKNLGDDVTPSYAVKDRQKVTKYKDYELSEDVITGKQEITRMKVTDGNSADYYGKPLTEETYMSYKPGENIIGKGGKPVKTQPEYEEGTAYLRSDRGNAGDVVDESTTISDDVIKEGTIFEDTLSEFGKADGGRIGYKLGKKVVETVIKKAGEGKFTKNEVLLNMFQNTIKATKDANTKTRFTNFIEEIKLKPELSKDPQVWNFFTKGLPKNQKLVVYGDDTVDFWTQSDFGPHNIAKSAKFQKKHPYLTKDQAVKIQNMEPEDQIFEMKRLEAIRKRTANASGGRIGFSAGKGIMAILKNFLKPKAKLSYLEKYPRIDIKELMKGEKPIKLYSGVGDRQANTLKAYKETAKDFNTTVDKVKKDNFKGQWWTPFKEYASGFGNARNIKSKMLTTELTPKEIKMALRYVEKINKKEKMISRMKMEKINNPPKYNLTTNENTVIIPKIKLKKLKKEGKIDTDYMILDKMKNKLGLSEGGLAAMLGE